MTTKPTLIFALFLVPTVAFSTAHAETYQWKDSNGQTVVSDVPPPPTVKGRRSIGGSQPSVVSEKPAEKSAEDAKAADAPKTSAEKDLEFKKRQQEQKEASDKAQKEAANKNTVKQGCVSEKQQLQLLESGERIATRDEKGERVYMDDNQRAAEIERTRKLVAEACK